MKTKGKTLLCMVSIHAMCLSACSSSSSSDGVQNAVFSDPIDAGTLRQALTTGSSAGDDEQFWQCTLSNTSTVLEYRLYADGNGLEANQSDPSANSAIRWQTLSATSLESTEISTERKQTLLNIQFSSADAFTGDLADRQLFCSREGSPAVPDTPVQATTYTLAYGANAYPVSHGFEEAFRFRGNDTHLTSRFHLANSDFELTLIQGALTTVSVWRPLQATIWLRADFHSPGSEGFTSATFSYEPDSTDEQGPLVAGRYFFNDGRFGFDANRNGSIDSNDNEFVDITAGTISVKRVDSGRRIQMSVDITLADGLTVKGSFEGSFPLFNHFEP